MRIPTKNVSSMIEVVILILLIAFVSSVALEAFAVAYKLKQRSADTAAAAILAENTIESLLIGPGAAGGGPGADALVPVFSEISQAGDFETRIGYDSDWNVMPNGADDYILIQQTGGDMAYRALGAANIPRYVMLLDLSNKPANGRALIDGTVSVFSLESQSVARLLTKMRFGDYSDRLSARQ